MSNLAEAAEISYKIQKQKEELEHLPHKVREVEEELQDIKASYEKKHQIWQEAHEQSIELKRRLQEERILLEERQTRLNSIKTQKEFQAVNREISNSKQSIKDDEKLLEELEVKLGALRSELDPLEAQVQALEEQKKSETDKISGGLTEQEEQLEQLNAQLNHILDQLPAEMKAKYLRVASVCQPPVAEVIQGTCQECFIQVPPQLFIKIQQKQEIYSCPSCQRLLYVETQNEAS